IHDCMQSVSASTWSPPSLEGGGGGGEQSGPEHGCAGTGVSGDFCSPTSSARARPLASSCLPPPQEGATAIARAAKEPFTIHARIANRYRVAGQAIGSRADISLTSRKRSSRNAFSTIAFIGPTRRAFVDTGASQFG